MLRVDTLRNLLRTRLDADAWALADDGLLAVRAGIQGTVADVRRIVEGLRPPALDELGLAEAVAQLADRLTAGGGLTTEVRADALPRLEAAVEVAAYRIAQEALANVLRHAGARSADVRLGCVPGGLVVEVRDDGRGEVVPRADGVGMASMRERAEEIGGTFTVVSTPGAGTTVRAFLPSAAGGPAGPGHGPARQEDPQAVTEVPA
jgi:signal transduction histidine kinase